MFKFLQSLLNSQRAIDLLQDQLARALMDVEIYKTAHLESLTLHNLYENCIKEGSARIRELEAKLEAATRTPITWRTARK